MADTSTALPTGPTAFVLNPASALEYLKRSDLGLAVGIMAILVVLILPLPRWLLDISLAFSLSFWWVEPVEHSREWASLVLYVGAVLWCVLTRPSIMTPAPAKDATAAAHP